MVHVCAWCERFLGLTSEQPQGDITHGICGPCMERQTLGQESSVLVLSRRKSHLLPLFTELLRGTPAIRVIVDRRQDSHHLEEPQPTQERRRSVSRRQSDIILH